MSKLRNFFTYLFSASRELEPDRPLELKPEPPPIEPEIERLEGEDAKDAEIRVLKFMVEELRTSTKKAWQTANYNYQTGEAAWQENKTRKQEIRAALHEVVLWLKLND